MFNVKWVNTCVVQNYDFIKQYDIFGNISIFRNDQYYKRIKHCHPGIILITKLLDNIFNQYPIYI